jgi:hypothetical protein
VGPGARFQKAGEEKFGAFQKAGEENFWSVSKAQNCIIFLDS